MEITSELLAAYAENKVTDEERLRIREYLTEHPEELESLLLMIDEDSEIELNDESAPKRSSFPSFTGHAVTSCCVESSPSEKPSRPKLFSLTEINRKIAGRLDSLIKEIRELN